MRVLKVGTTASLSNRSTLGYAIGCDDARRNTFSVFGAILQVACSSKCWVAFLDIAEALVHADKITSGTLKAVYSNTSNNNAGFMLAVLLAEGLVNPFDRHYIRNDFKPFLQHINALIDAGVDLGDADEALASKRSRYDCGSARSRCGRGASCQARPSIQAHIAAPIADFWVRWSLSPASSKKKLFQNNGLEKGCIFHRSNTDPNPVMAVPDRLAWHDYIRKTAYVCTHGCPAGDHFSIVCLFINPAHWAAVHRAVGFLVSPCGCCTALYWSGRSRFYYLSKENSP
jgi:hypothetical protein